MNAAVIKVRFADAAKAGKKQATIRTEDGQIFGVWPDKFGLLRPGRTYKVEFKEREFEGKIFRTIVKCEPVSAVEESTAGLAQSSQRSSQSISEAEFVTRLLAAGIQCGGVVHSEQSMVAEVKLLRSVYRTTFGAQA